LYGHLIFLPNAHVLGANVIAKTEAMVCDVPWFRPEVFQLLHITTMSITSALNNPTAGTTSAIRVFHKVRKTPKPGEIQKKPAKKVH
jgi:hypothetical protein